MRWWWIVALASACVEEDPCAPTDATPAVQLGVGERAFAPAVDGQDVTLVHGPQGGYHIELALAVTGLVERERVPVVLSGTIDGEQLGLSAPYVSFLCDREAAQGVAWGLRLIFDAEPEDLAERDVAVTATVDPGDGTSLQDALNLHIVDPLVTSETP